MYSFDWVGWKPTVRSLCIREWRVYLAYVNNVNTWVLKRNPRDRLTFPEEKKKEKNFPKYIDIPSVYSWSHSPSSMKNLAQVWKSANVSPNIYAIYKYSLNSRWLGGKWRYESVECIFHTHKHLYIHIEKVHMWFLFCIHLRQVSSFFFFYFFLTLLSSLRFHPMRLFTLLPLSR